MIMWGTTRVVLMIPRSTTVIKIVRPRVVRPLLQLVRHMWSGQVQTRLQNFHRNPWQGGLRYVLAGIVANRQEWRVSQAYPSAPLAVVTRLYCGGLVIVQARGAAIGVGDIDQVSRHPLWNVMVDETGSPEEALRQFARFGERILLVDFGWWKLRELLPLHFCEA